MAALAQEVQQLRSLRGLVDEGLEALLPDAGAPPHRVHAAMRYAVLSPGKRLRPVLTLLSACHLGCAPETALPGACALEFIHAASLVLDDLPCMDNALTRRGQPSVHVRYGQDVAVLAGIALLNEAFAVIGRASHVRESDRLQMVSLLARTVGPNGLVGGQEKDLRAEAEPTATYVSQLHHEKTGVLFVAAVEMGALSAGATPGALETLRRFAIELGLAFQALDDLEDHEEDAASDRSAVNLTGVLGREGLRHEAQLRLERAKQALNTGPAELAPIGGYVDILLGRMAA